LIGYVREYRNRYGSSLLAAKAAVLAGWRPGDSSPPPDQRDDEIAHLRARAEKAERERDDLGNAYRVAREECEVNRAHGDGGCGCCSICGKEARDDRDAARVESARLRARLAEVEGAALRLCDEIAPTLSHVHDDAMVALRAVLSRTEGRTPEVKP
jgi:hypothetical protein